jgi:alpha,alpha-trehalase
VLPVDLNCQLYRYEKDFSLFSEMLGRPKEANAWRTKAEARRTLINQYFWDEESGFYWDYDLQALDRLRSTPRSLASFVPLWAEVANQTQASRMLQHLPVFEYEYGLVACEKGWNDDSEHNYPTGWAYSHWYVIYGLRCYQYHRDATRIAMKWLRLNARKFVETGVLRERYNVVQPDARLPGRYGPQRGFGWTNGIFAALLIRVIFGIEVEHVGGQLRWEASFPDEWQGQKSHLSLPDYPYPTGITV